MTLLCRPATDEDLDGIAAVRIRTWQDAYRGIMPQDYLDGLTPAAAADRLRRRGLGPGISVAELDGAIVGFSAAGPFRDGDVPAPRPGCGEIIAIYVLPGHQGAGIGRALMTHSLGVLGELRPALLRVARDNAPARRFYERYGLRPDGARQTFTVGGTEVPEVRYRYPA